MSLSRSDDTAPKAESVRILRAEAFFHKIYQQVATGIAVTNWQGVFQQCNPAFCALLGYTEKELRSMAFASLIHPEDREANLALVRRLLVGEIPSFEIENRYIHKNGEQVWVHKFVSSLHGEEGEPTDLIALVTNITVRKLTDEVRLRQSAIVESSDDAIIGVDRNGTVTDWNKGAERLFGYAAIEAIGRNISFLSPAVLSESGAAVLERVLKGEVLRHYETLLPRKDGTLVEISLTVSPMVDATGRIVGASGIVHDITERKKAEATIRESEERYRRIVETTNEGVWLLDSRLHTSYVNRQMAKMLGYEPEAMVGRSVLDFYFPEDVEQKKQVLMRRQQGLREQLEERLRPKDGSILWARIAASPVFKDTGEFDGALAMVSDITERKLAEEALRNSEERFRLAARAGKMYAYAWNVDTDVIVRSGDFPGVLGPTGEVFLTRKELQVNVHPDDRSLVNASVSERTPEHPDVQISYRMLRPDGSVVWVEKTAHALFDEQGRMLSMVGLVADITERKQAEEALSGMTRKLLEAQEQERARIARELHDDVSQRLAMLSMELEQLQDKPADEVKSRVPELRARLNEVSTDVQGLSHDLHSSKLDYLGVVAGVKSWCKEFADRRGIEIDFSSDVQSTVPHEIGLSLFRVLQEALHNVIKHSGARRVEVQLRQNSNEIQMAVCDLGRGFDLDAALRGKGLGLMSMQERVRLVRGTIVIKSKSMGGTSIQVRVPFESERRSRRAAV